MCVSFIKTHCDSWDKLGRAQYRCYIAPSCMQFVIPHIQLLYLFMGLFHFHTFPLLICHMCSVFRALLVHFFHIASIFLSIGTQFIFQFHVSRGLFCDTLCLTLGMSTFCCRKSIAASNVQMWGTDF